MEEDEFEFVISGKWLSGGAISWIDINGSKTTETIIIESDEYGRAPKKVIDSLRLDAPPKVG